MGGKRAIRKGRGREEKQGLQVKLELKYHSFALCNLKTKAG